MSFKFVTRQEWGAEPPLEEIDKVEKPAKLLLLHTTQTKRCTDKKTCMRSIRSMQKDDMKDGFPDIIYNFLVGGDNIIYEGRGWDFVGVSYNSSADAWKARRKIDIAFIGVFKESTFSLPSFRMIHAASNFIDYGVQEKHLHPKYKYYFVDRGDPRNVGSLSKLAVEEYQDEPY